MDASTPITARLRDWQGGDREALDEVMSLVYSQLRAMCARRMRNERKTHTLNPTALANEVYLRLARLSNVRVENRVAFFGFLSRLMRNVLVEHARAIRAKKRGGAVRIVALEKASEQAVEPRVLDVLAIDEALSQLEAHDPDLVSLVELRFFGGLTQREVAELLRTSRATVQRDWDFAKRFLARALLDKPESYDGGV